MGKTGDFVSRMFRKLSSSGKSPASEEQRTAAVPIKQCKDRDVVELTGTIAAVAVNPRSGHPALEAELRDGSGAVTLIWLGRRQIAGIEAGRSVWVSGRICSGEDGRVIYNPRYELNQSSRTA